MLNDLVDRVRAEFAACAVPKIRRGSEDEPWPSDERVLSRLSWQSCSSPSRSMRSRLHARGTPTVADDRSGVGAHAPIPPLDMLGPLCG